MIILTTHGIKSLTSSRVLGYFDDSDTLQLALKPEVSTENYFSISHKDISLLTSIDLSIPLDAASESLRFAIGYDIANTTKEYIIIQNYFKTKSVFLTIDNDNKLYVDESVTLNDIRLTSCFEIHNSSGDVSDPIIMDIQSGNWDLNTKSSTGLEIFQLNGNLRIISYSNGSENSANTQPVSISEYGTVDESEISILKNNVSTISNTLNNISSEINSLIDNVTNKFVSR